MADPNTRPDTAIVLGATADIGREICHRLLGHGWRVIGAGRDPERVANLAENPKFNFLACDLTDPASVRAATESITEPWRLFISCAGTMEPIGKFFELDFDAWEQSVEVNSTAQLRFLHGIWGNRTARPDVMFLAGGGTNNPFPNYSAYCVSKIALIKMCELLWDEEEDLNVFIIGPGYMRTRIHDETLRAGAFAGEALEKTAGFLESGAEGTTHDRLFAHVMWCLQQGRDVVGGRNFSTVHDPWDNPDSGLSEQLRGSLDGFRLRRYSDLDPEGRS